MNCILNKYRKLSSPLKASFWFVISNIILKGISFITLPIFARLLTTEQYGIVSVYQSWVSIVSILSTLTIWGGVFNVVMVKQPTQQEEIVSSFQGLASTITISFLAIAILFRNSLSKIFGLSQILTIVVFFEILVSIPFNLWSVEQKFHYKYKALVLISITTAIVNPVLGYYTVISTGCKAEARIFSALFVQAVLGIYIFFLNQLKGKKYFSANLWRFGFTFNIVLIPHYLSTQILNLSDRLMIHSICGSSDAGIYSVAYTFAMLLSVITNGINASLTPFIYQSIKDKNTGDLVKKTNAVVLMVAVFSIGLICVVPEIFRFMLPNSYYPALKVIPPVTAGAFFLFLYPLFGSVEFYFEANKFITIASIIGAITNIILNYICISIFGFIAAAYTTLFCYIMFSVAHFCFMNRVLISNNFKGKLYDMKTISIISICVIGSTIGITFLYNNSYIRWGIILLIMIIVLIKRKHLKNILMSVLAKS